MRNDALLALPFRFECHTASDAAALPASMNGLGRRPLPAAISSMLRPEATDWSWSVTGAPLSRSWPSRCLIRSQLLRLLRSRSWRMRTSTQLPCSFSPASVNFSSPLRSAAFGIATVLRQPRSLDPIA